MTYAMPPPKTYGKKSRQIYGSVAAFASPQRSPDSFIDDRRKPTITKSKDSDKTVVDGDPRRKTNVTRKALGKISANRVVEPIDSLKSQSKNMRAHRRKVAVEDSDEDQDGPNIAIPDISVPNLSLEEISKHPHEVTLAGVQQDPVDGVDSVPLFCDGHGYDTKDEEPMQPIKSPSKSHEYLQITPERSKELAPLETPSISILPPTPPMQDEYAEHCAKLLEVSSHQIDSYSEWAHALSSHLSITKIAEATFGEVYRLSALKRISGFTTNDESVLKVIALTPPDSRVLIDQHNLSAAAKRIEDMSKPTDVVNEVRLLQRMTDVPGFTNFREVRILKGRPAQPFIKAYKAFNTVQKAKKKELSIFPDPAKQANYAEDQLWAVIEMQDAGTDLELAMENGDCNDIWFAWDVFWQVALSLAKGEELAEFEHRDLHLGNICVHRPERTGDKALNIDPKRKLNFTGLETTIIDYTISRAFIHDSTIAYKELTVESGIFDGDSEDEYQYEIYRYMRAAVFLDDPFASFPQTLSSPAQERTWEQYHPVTNLIWLHYILYMLLEAQVEWPSSTKPPSKTKKEEYARWKRANDLEHVLLRAQDLLHPGSIFENDLRSASALVLHAISEGWVDQADVVGESKSEVEEVESALIPKFDGLEIEARAVGVPLEVGGALDVDLESARPRSKMRTRRDKG